MEAPRELPPAAAVQAIITGGSAALPRELLSVAPMMACTDRHYRYMMRLLTRRTTLYSEMLVDSTLKFSGRATEMLRFSPVERPLVCQLGGCTPAWLAEVAPLVQAAGYDAINLNCGCPSAAVAGKGAFGARLMFNPALVRDCVMAMRQVVSLPITVKCRLGADGMDSYEAFADFIRVVATGGCTHFIVHARKCLLKGLSPKDNRTVPPLRYHWVQRAALEFPHLRVGLNGGVGSVADAAALMMLRRVEPLGAASTLLAVPVAVDADWAPPPAADKRQQRRALREANEAACRGALDDALVANAQEAEEAEASSAASCCSGEVEAGGPSSCAGECAPEPRAVSAERERCGGPGSAAAVLSDGYPANPMLQLHEGCEERPGPHANLHRLGHVPGAPAAGALPAVAAGAEGSTPATAERRESEGRRYPPPASFAAHAPGDGAASVAACLAVDSARVLLDSVMVGRAAYSAPWAFADADRLFFGEQNPGLSRREVVLAYLDYTERVTDGIPADELERTRSHFAPLTTFKPLLGLFYGCPGGARFRSQLSALVASRRVSLREAVSAALATAGIPDDYMDERAPAA